MEKLKVQQFQIYYELNNYLFTIHKSQSTMHPVYAQSYSLANLSCSKQWVKYPKLDEVVQMTFQAFMLLVRPCPATKVYTEPCPAYEDVVVQACNWGWNVLVLNTAVLHLQLHYICTEKYLAVPLWTWYGCCIMVWLDRLCISGWDLRVVLVSLLFICGVLCPVLCSHFVHHWGFIGAYANKLT